MLQPEIRMGFRVELPDTARKKGHRVGILPLVLTPASLGLGQDDRVPGCEGYRRSAHGQRANLTRAKMNSLVNVPCQDVVLRDCLAATDTLTSGSPEGWKCLIFEIAALYRACNHQPKRLGTTRSPAAAKTLPAAERGANAGVRWRDLE